VISNGLIFLSGQTPTDPATGELVEGSIGDQTRRCLDNLAVVAAAAGAQLADAVRCGIYVTDISTFKDVNEAYGAYFESEPPARSTIGVAALPLGAQVEIDAILAVPD
jgi:2-iminobutanoate/2-iminopropanoate deaminase